MPPDLKQLLPQLLLAAGGLRGNSDGFRQRWAELEQMEAQRQQQAQIEAQRQQELAMRQSADTRAQQQQAMQAANSVRQLAEVGDLDDPDVYAQRRAFALQMAPQMGIEPGFVEGLFRIPPTKFEVNEAKKKLAEIEKTYAPQQMAMLEADDETGSAPLFTLRSGKKMTVAQLRELAGTQPMAQSGAPVSMRPPTASAAPRDLSTASLDVQAAAALAAGDTEAYERLKRVKKEMGQADDRPPAPTGGDKPLTQNQRANIISSRRTQWQRFSKAVTDREVSVGKIDAGVAALDRGNRNAATQAIIMGFNKLLDETSVVREGEYARSEQLVPIINRIEGAIQRVVVGGASMTDADLRGMATEAKAIAQTLRGVSEEAARNLRQAIQEELDDYAIPHSRVFGGSTIGASAPAPASTTPRGDRSRDVVLGRTKRGPQVGERRTDPATGVTAEWDGTGWKKVAP